MVARGTSGGVDRVKEEVLERESESTLSVHCVGECSTLTKVVKLAGAEQFCVALPPAMLWSTDTVDAGTRFLCRGRGTGGRRVWQRCRRWWRIHQGAAEVARGAGSRWRL